MSGFHYSENSSFIPSQKVEFLNSQGFVPQKNAFLAEKALQQANNSVTLLLNWLVTRENNVFNSFLPLNFLFNCRGSYWKVCFPHSSNGKTPFDTTILILLILFHYIGLELLE